RVETSIGFQRGLGDKYRKERSPLATLLDRAHDADSDLGPGLERIAARSADNAPIVAELRAAEQRGHLTLSVAELVPSYIHMHVNRMIRSAQRAHELVLYDLLVRLYESQTARAKPRCPGRRRRRSTRTATPRPHSAPVCPPVLLLQQPP